MRYSVEVNVVVGNSSEVVLAHNPRRRAIVITTDTNPILLTQSATAAVGKGIQIPNGVYPTTLCCRELGEWITYQLSAIAPLGNTNVCIIEVLADPMEDVGINPNIDYYA